MRRDTLLLCILALTVMVSFVACSAMREPVGVDSGPSDSGVSDSGSMDSGSTDSGPPDSGPTDSGPTDSAVPTDAPTSGA